MATAQQWVLRRKPSPEFADQFPDLDPLVAQILYARKIDTPQEVRTFLGAGDPLGDPLLLPDMQPAIERLLRALADHEPIVIYGDFDVDGVCATTLLLTTLRALGADVRTYIPDRFSEAYGLNSPALDTLHAEGASLVVTVDCGIRSVAEVTHARSLGLDMIVTDHHSVPAELPAALAVINPRRADSAYPYHHLAGVGVAFRLAEALLSAAPAGQVPGQKLSPDDLLDLVALGTVADIVPLTGENRVLAQRGIARMRSAPRPGIRALLQVAGTKPELCDSQTIGFRLGPRLNAAGRLRHAQMGLDLLTAQDDELARGLAEELDQVNQERQALLETQVARAQELLSGPVSAWAAETWQLLDCQFELAARLSGAPAQGLRETMAGAVDSVIDQVREAARPPLLFVCDEGFHEGIVGLIASRLVNAHYRPALVMRRDEDHVRGSARSIEGFHITHALDACSDLLERFGGHAQAAGFSLLASNLQPLHERLLAYAQEHLTPADFAEKLAVDAIVPLEAVADNSPAALAALEPFGEGNPEPSLASLGLTLDSVRTMGQEGRHLRLQVSAGSRVLTGIAFRQGHMAQELAPGSLVDLVYRPTLNEWDGQTTLQLLVQAIRPTAH
jgi:single-stranded-DNA-specific exonuclease